MTRPTHVYIDPHALLHNIAYIRNLAPHSKIIAMVKANAYGCGLSFVLPVLEGKVDALGVASLEEAIAVRKLGSRCECILFQGVFRPEELFEVVNHNLQIVIHQENQLQWLLAEELSRPIKVWVKVNTGMHRLGFAPDKVESVFNALKKCTWVNKKIGFLTHLACADEPLNSSNQRQIQLYNSLQNRIPNTIRSIANSAAIIALPETHADAVRPGIMLYGVSPFSNQIGQDLGLLPVMHFVSAISAIHHYPPHSPIGYGGTWQSNKPSTIGIVPVGYGDGYPRHIKPGTCLWVNGTLAPIVGRVCMDMMMVDLSECSNVAIGDPVELWGTQIPVETIAESAGTIAYELLCQLSPRVRNQEPSYISVARTP